MPEGYTGADVYARMNRFNGDTSTLDMAHQSATALTGTHEELVRRMTTIQLKLESSWTGDASAKAQSGLNPLIQTSQRAAADLTQSSRSMSDQNSAFHDTRAKLVPMDSSRPSTDDLGSYWPFGASDSEKAAAQWDTNDKNNKEAYGSYYATTDGNRNTAAKDYPVLNAAPAGINVGPPQPIGSVGGFTGDTSTSTGGHRTSGGQTPGSGNTQQPGQQHQQPVTPPDASHQTPGTSGSGQTPGSGGSDQTSTSGYTPPKPPVSSAPGFGSGLLPTFGSTGSGADTPYTGGIGGIGSGAFSGNLTGGGNESGTGQRLGGGTGSGTGERVTAARPGAGGAAGTSGAKGAPGMGGMGHGGGKGKEEDKEHQRKIALPDQDPDDLFAGGDYPDGMKPVPPTIGA